VGLAQLLDVPLRQNWWTTIPGINPQTKLSYALEASWQSGPEAEQGFMVYLKAQADTSNSISDWNLKGEYVLRQLETVANSTQPGLMSAVASLQSDNKVTRVTQFTIMNAIFVHGTLDAARQLGRRHDVAIIEPEHRYSLHKEESSTAVEAAIEKAQAQNIPNTVELGVNYVHAPQVWAMGYRGQGVVVANIDTGVDYLHPALNRQYRGNLGGGNYDHNYNWYDTRLDAPRQNVPYDDDSHGTHTMGTTVGEDASLTNQIGVAPGAKWMAAKVFPNGGSSGNEELNVAEDFMLAPWDLNKQNRRPDLRPQVINNSWGDSECWNTDSWFVTQAWIDAGIIPSFSNGNSGSAAGTVGSPGGYPFLIGTGAISASSGNIASFSSRGPSCFGGVIKPDVVAPGVNVRSSFPNNTYGAISGTSMASPHNAGVMALMLSVNPSLTYTEVTGILTRTTFFNPSWGVKPNNNYGWGLIQADAAVDMVMHGAHVHGTVNSGTGPLQGATVTALRTSDSDLYRFITGSNGTYSMTVRAGTYDLTASAFGYASQTVSGVVVMSDTSPVQNFTLTPLTTYALSGTFYRSGCQTITGTLTIQPPGSVVSTDGNGVYSVNLPAGTYTLTAQAGIYMQPISEVITISGPTTRNYTFGAARDTGNTYYVDNPGAVTPISGTTQLTFSDGEDGYAAVALPFPFTFYGTPYTTTNVSTNGFMTFNDFTEARMWVNTTIPQPGPTADDTQYKYPNNAIYAYWDDLSVAPRSYGAVYTEMTGSSPSRIFTIEWRGIAGTDVPITFEVQLEETTNRVTVLYSQIGGPYGYGYSSTQGIENATGTDGIQLGFNQAGMVSNGMAIRYIPGSTPTVTPCVPTPIPTSTLPAITVTPVSTSIATATATVCAVSFIDVDPENTFYSFIRCLVCRGIISGYDDGTFRPFNDITRGQIAKIVSNAAGFDEDPGAQIYEDVPVGSPFYQWINRLSMRGHIGGYPCGLTEGEPCIEPDNLPYFRPSSSATRGQLAKIVSNAAGLTKTPTGQYYTDVPEGHTFYLWIMRLTDEGVMSGYDCGGDTEPCDEEQRPYFRPFNNVTRGQASKIVANTFFPGCETPSQR
jgi:subtilisin family serine protease